MPRRVLLLPLIILSLVAAAFAAMSGSAVAELVGVSEVSASKPSFGPNETITITVVATDDSGELRISSNLPGSKLSVTGCSGVGNQVSGRCDSNGLDSVEGNGTRDIFINTAAIDSDTEPEGTLEVSLHLTAPCATATAVTIDADQPENAGPDLVTINCIPPTPTPTPTATSTPISTATPLPTATPPAPTATPVPPTPVSQVLSSGIKPPSTGSAGLK